MSGPRPYPDQVKMAMATLAVCVVRTLEKQDDSFEGRFLEQLDRAYELLRAKEDWDQPVFETLAWTRELLTGFSLTEGQGRAFLK